MQCTYRVHPAVQATFDAISSHLGRLVLLDAASVGIYAHRLRFSWTNLCDPSHLQTELILLNPVHYCA